MKWKPIPGYEGYEASDSGEIRSWRSKHGKLTKPRILKTGLSVNGYRKVSPMSKERGHGVCTKVSRLVALAFIGQRPKDLQIAHLNGNKIDDRAANLKYCTAKENHGHKKIHGTYQIGEKHPNYKHGRCVRKINK